MAEPQAIDETRKKLGGLIGQSAVDFGLLSDENRERVLEVKARLMTLEKLGKLDGSITVAAVGNDDEWKKIAVERGVVPDANTVSEPLNAAREEIHANGLAGAGVASFGEIAAQLNFIPAADKSALLAAQAAERTAQVVERVNTPSTEPAKSELALLDVVKAKKWNAAGNANDPAYLKTAQEVNFKAELLDAAIAISPELRNRPSVADAANALDTLSSISHMNAANVLAGDLQPVPDGDARRAASQAIRLVAEKQITSPDKALRELRTLDNALSDVMVSLGQENKVSAATLLEVTGAIKDKSFSRPQEAARVVGG